MSDEELDLRHHLTPDEAREWKTLKSQPNTREDWAELNALITAFRRRFIERHRAAASRPGGEP